LGYVRSVPCGTIFSAFQPFHQEKQLCGIVKIKGRIIGQGRVTEPLNTARSLHIVTSYNSDTSFPWGSLRYRLNCFFSIPLPGYLQKLFCQYCRNYNYAGQ
jgi:hypothetical protein